MNGRQRKTGRTVRRRRRGGPGCFSVLLFSVLVAAAFVAVTTIFFRIDEIEVVGNERYRTDEVRTASGIEHGGNLIFFNKFSAVSDIFAELPYVEEVDIIRNLPGTLIIKVVETHAIAAAETEEGYWLLNENAKLLEKTAVLPEGLITVEGLTLKNPETGKHAEAAGEDTTKVETLVAVLSELESGGMLHTVGEISLDGVYDVSMEFLDRFTVELGMPEQLEYKLEFLLEIVDRLGGEASGIIDLSVLVEEGEARFRQYAE